VKKRYFIVLLVLLLASPAFAGGKVRALNIFPFTLQTESVPLYPDNVEELCKTDVEGTICENGELTQAVANGVNFSPPTYATAPCAYHHHAGDYDFYACSGAAIAVITDGCLKACVKDGAYWKCDDHGREALAVTATGGSCTEKPITPATIGKPTFQEGNVNLSCPDADEVKTQDVEYKQLVTSACPGQTIQVEATGYAWKELTAKYRIAVRYFKPGKTTFGVILKTDREKNVVNGFFYDSLEEGFTFEKPGTYAFIFWIRKPDGSLGSARSRTVVVPETCAQ
jgi:hypothetical protein